MFEFDIDDRDVTRAMRRLLGPDGRAVLRAGNQKAAKIVRDELERRPLSRQQRASIRAVRVIGTNQGAALGWKRKIYKARWRSRAETPFIVPAFFGAKSNWGWYGYRRYRGSSGNQFPKWVGNRFDPGFGGRAGRPYHMTEAELKSWPKVTEQFVKAWVAAFETEQAVQRRAASGVE